MPADHQLLCRLDVHLHRVSGLQQQQQTQPHTHTIQVERQKIMRYSRSGMNSMPLANEIHYTKYGTFRLHDSLETVRSLRAERSEREEEGGKSKCSEEGRETSQPSDVRKAPRRPFIITL